MTPNSSFSGGGGDPTVSGTQVSIIIAARDAERTLPETLASLRSQKFERWEAIVVDDGSTDGTATVAEAAAKHDQRIHVVRQAGKGLSAARNAGIEQARGEWLLFLDSDDLLLPEALKALVQATADDPTIAVAYCGFARIDTTGTVRLAETQATLSGDLFDQFSRRCVFACHCALVRRTIVVGLRGFDITLPFCEDWDLWQRIARTGASFRPVERILALYRTHPDSMSMNVAGLAATALRIIERGHAPDPRVSNPAPEHTHGAPPDLLPLSRLDYLLWVAGLTLGKGEGGQLPAELQAELGPVLAPGLVVDQLFDAIPIGACVPASAWPQLWHRFEHPINTFLQELERVSGAPSLAARSSRRLQRRVIEASPGAVSQLGCFADITVELTKPLPDIQVDADLLHCRIELEARPLGTIELPVCDGAVPAYVLADAIGARYAWEILGRFFQTTDPAYEIGRHDELGWPRFLRELWGRPSWPEDAFYDRPDLTGHEATDGEAFTTLEVSEDLPDIDVREGRLIVQIEVGGTPIGLLTLDGSRVVTADELCVVTTDVTGFELCRSAVRQALIGREPPPGLRLRELLRDAARSKPNPVAAALAPRQNGLLLARRLPGVFGTSGSRRAVLPAAALNDLRQSAEAAADQIVQVGPASEQPKCIVYAPEVIASQRASVGDDSSGADGYEHGTAEHVTDALPILMYHRIASDIEGPLARYTVTPGSFEEQLDYLQAAGYRSISLDEWRVAVSAKRPLPGQAVMITFDDGYLDFLTNALPLLRRYGFAAAVFLVAERIGETNRWDGFAPQLPLLGWSDINRVPAESVTFGSHTATHPALTGLSNSEIVNELARSRAVLQAGFGYPVSAFAYPYGDYDLSVAHLLGGSGYTFGLTTDSRKATFEDSLLALPRIEITGSDSIENFALKLAEW